MSFSGWRWRAAPAANVSTPLLLRLRNENLGGPAQENRFRHGGIPKFELALLDRIDVITRKIGDERAVNALGLSAAPHEKLLSSQQLSPTAKKPMGSTPTPIGAVQNVRFVLSCTYVMRGSDGWFRSSSGFQVQCTNIGASVLIPKPSR